MIESKHEAPIEVYVGLEGVGSPWGVAIVGKYPSRKRAVVGSDAHGPPQSLALLHQRREDLQIEPPHDFVC
jgi:hypothetical protein